MILYTKQQKSHRCKEQTFGLCGRRWGWDDLKEEHWNLHITICKIDKKYKFDEWSKALKAGALELLRGMRWGRRWKGFQVGGHMCTTGWFMSMYGNNHHNSAKKLSSNDGRVEGHALIFSWKNSKITSHSWTTIDRRILVPTKESYAMSRGEGEVPVKWY